jgi:hypothetical protein
VAHAPATPVVSLQLFPLLPVSLPLQVAVGLAPPSLQAQSQILLPVEALLVFLTATLPFEQPPTMVSLHCALVMHG